MTRELRRLLAFVVTLALLVTSTPTTGVAEELLAEHDEGTTTPAIAYRLHTRGEEELAEDAPWYAYDLEAQASQVIEEDLGLAHEDVPEDVLAPATEANETLVLDEMANDASVIQEEQSLAEEASDESEEPLLESDEVAPLDGIQLKLWGDSTGVAYRVRALDGTWPEQWESDDTYVLAEEGMSAIQIRLSEELQTEYDVWYRVRTQSGAWLGWASNGADAGTDTSLLTSLQAVILTKGSDAPQGDELPAYELGAEESEEVPEGTEPLVAPEPTQPEEITVQDVEVVEDTTSEKTSSKQTALKTQEATTTPYVAYRTRMRAEKWSTWAKNSTTSGGVDSGRRMEGVQLKLKGVEGGISYKVYLQGKKWSQGWKSNGKTAGMPGKERRIEAIRIRLTGTAKKQYDVYYRAYVPFIGWMGWTKNGAVAGSVGFSYRMEGLQVALVKKGEAAPSNDDAATTLPCFGKMTVSYAAALKSGGWQTEVKNGSVAGVAKKTARMQQLSASLAQGAGIRYATCTNAGAFSKWAYDGAVAGTSGTSLTAVRFQLTGALKKHYNVWYRTYVKGKGWLGWAKNGAKAGSDAATNPIGAIQVKVLRKSAKAPGKTSTPYALTKQLNGVDVYGGDYSLGFNAKTVTADFVIIKATQGYGDIYYSPKNGYKKLADAALAAGKQIGFYHYAEGRDAKKEAQYFYNAIKDYKGRAIACLDWEGSGPSDPNNPYFGSGIDVTWCKTFLTEIQRLFGGTPFLYTGKNETNTYNWSSVAKKFPLWGAEYAYADYVYQGYQSNPWQSSRPWGAWGANPTIFQYGAVNPKPNNGGVSDLDADLFYGTVSDWKSYCK